MSTELQSAREGSMNVDGEETNILKTVPIFDGKLIDATIFLTKTRGVYTMI